MTRDGIDTGFTVGEIEWPRDPDLEQRTWPTGTRIDRVGGNEAQGDDEGGR